MSTSLAVAGTQHGRALLFRVPAGIPMVLDVSLVPLLVPVRDDNGRAPHRSAPRGLSRVGVIGNHLPRQCGIATFTTALRDAIAVAFPALDAQVVAMNDPGPSHAYPASVRFSIADHDIAAYRRAADYLNGAHLDAVSVQHEYGIFGGRAGALVLTLLRELRMPIVTTLHTVLAAPDPAQRRVLDEILRLSARVVVMSNHAATLLAEVHAMSADRIDVIPHGIPTEMFSRGDKDTIG
ncbi:MAG: glycosyltransferase, partial [Gemmatimonadaceae bacterium]|nr:glycosyltransferase [Gemmatimonadaceae bacterium]